MKNELLAGIYYPWKKSMASPFMGSNISHNRNSQTYIRALINENKINCSVYPGRKKSVWVFPTYLSLKSLSLFLPFSPFSLSLQSSLSLPFRLQG